MKRSVRYYILAAAFSFLLSICAFALENDNPASPGICNIICENGVTLTMDAAVESVYINDALVGDFYANAEYFTVSYKVDSETIGEQYMIFVLNEKSAPTENNIIYMNQSYSELSPEGTAVTFARVYPSSLCGTSYVYITGKNKPFTPETPDASLLYYVPYSLGDVDEDGNVTSADAAKLLRYVTQLETLDGRQVLAADVDGDGKITAADASKILRYVAQIENL